MIQLIFIAYTLFVIFLSLFPLPASPAVGYTDKVVHFVLYGILVFVAYVSVSTLKRRLYLFLFAIVLGITLEFFQIYVPGRYASLLDTAANVGGALTGLIICLLYTRFYGGKGAGGMSVPGFNGNTD